MTRSAPSQRGCARRLRKTADGSKKMLPASRRRASAGASSTVRACGMKLNPKRRGRGSTARHPGRSRPRPSGRRRRPQQPTPKTTPGTTNRFVLLSRGESSLHQGMRDHAAHLNLTRATPKVIFLRARPPQGSNPLLTAHASDIFPQPTRNAPSRSNRLRQSLKAIKHSTRKADRNDLGRWKGRWHSSANSRRESTPRWHVWIKGLTADREG